MNKEELNKLYSPLTEGAKAWVIEHQKNIHLSIRVWFFCVLVALLAPFIIFVLGVNSHESAQWFQRSGTFILVFSLLAEIKVQKVKTLVFVVDANYLGCHRYIEGKNKKHVPYIQYATYLIVVLGTLVTGYGDIFFSEVSLLLKS